MFSPRGSHTIVVFPYQTSWQYSDGDPTAKRDVECSRDEYLPLVSMTAAVRTTTATVHRAVYRTDRHASVDTYFICHKQNILFITTNMDDHDEETKTEHNWIIHNAAEVANNRRLHSPYCTVEAKCRQTRSIARPLCDSRATCVTKRGDHNRWMRLSRLVSFTTLRQVGTSYESSRYEYVWPGYAIAR